LNGLLPSDWRFVVGSQPLVTAWPARYIAKPRHVCAGQGTGGGSSSAKRTKGRMRVVIDWLPGPVSPRRAPKGAAHDKWSTKIGLWAEDRGRPLVTSSPLGPACRAGVRKRVRACYDVDALNDGEVWRGRAARGVRALCA